MHLALADRRVRSRRLALEVGQRRFDHSADCSNAEVDDLDRTAAVVAEAAIMDLGEGGSEFFDRIRAGRQIDDQLPGLAEVAHSG